MSDVKLKLMQSQITHAIQLTNQSVLENPWIRPRPLKFELINQRSARWRNILYWVLIPWQTRTHCCGHIVVHDVSWTAQTEKHLVRTQNVSEQSQKHFFVSGKQNLCPQQMLRARETFVSSFARAFRFLFQKKKLLNSGQILKISVVW